jgi:hypothetical protein
MRITIIIAAVLLSAVAPLRADDQSTALATITEAIKAHGGEEALARLRTVVRKTAGTMTVAGKDVTFAEEQTAQLPQRWRCDAEALAGKQKLRVLVVVNGDKGWHTSGGAATELSDERLKELREEMYARWLTTLLPLKEPALRLAPLPEAKVNGEPAVGVKVSSDRRPDVSLYFDKKTHFLVKSERKATEGGTSQIKEDVYSAYNEFDGVRLPTKMVRSLGGKKVSEFTTATYTFPRKVDDGTFAKP